jgi:hypothetical protein
MDVGVATVMRMAEKGLLDHRGNKFGREYFVPSDARSRSALVDEARNEMGARRYTIWSDRAAGDATSF